MSGNQTPYSEVTDKISAVRRKNTYEIILEQLEDLILSGTLEPGQKLPGERLLSEKFGASRNSVRVALKLLDFMNLLEVRPGSGVYVSSRQHLNQATLNSHWSALLKQHPLMDLIEARRGIEPFITGLAARNATDMEIHEMEDDLSMMEADIMKQGKVVQYASLFHEILFRSSHNLILAQIGMMLNNLMDESKKVSLSNWEKSKQSLEDHQGILDAVKLHDPDLAEERMLVHLDGVKTHLIEAGLFHTE